MQHVYIWIWFASVFFLVIIIDSPFIIHTGNLCKSQIYIYIYIFFTCLWAKISFQCNKDNILTKTWWSCHKYLQNCNSCYLIRPHYLKLMREVILTSLLGQKNFMFIWEKLKGFYFWERGGKLNIARGLVIADKDTQTSFLVHAVCSPVFHFRNVKMKLTNKYLDFIIIKTNPNALKIHCAWSLSWRVPLRKQLKLKIG